MQSNLTEAEKNRALLSGTNHLTSEELKELANCAIALRLYFLIANGTDKGEQDFYEIGKHLHSFAIQLIGRMESNK